LPCKLLIVVIDQFQALGHNVSEVTHAPVDLRMCSLVSDESCGTCRVYHLAAVVRSPRESEALIRVMLARNIACNEVKGVEEEDASSNRVVAQP
jgi:hypothetical protein